MFKNIFKMNKTLDVLTVFHSPKSAESTAVLNLLKSANAAAEAEPDKKPLFELDVEEGPMTATQLKSVLEYIGGEAQAGQVVEGASDMLDATKKLEGGSGKLVRPITVDWNNGKAVIGKNESALQAMLQKLSKS